MKSPCFEYGIAAKFVTIYSYNRDWLSSQMNLGVNASPLQWLHKRRDGVSNHQLLDCLLSCLSRRISKKAQEAGEFPAQRASNAKIILIDDVIMLMVETRYIYEYICF